MKKSFFSPSGNFWSQKRFFFDLRELFDRKKVFSHPSTLQGPKKKFFCFLQYAGPEKNVGLRPCTLRSPKKSFFPTPHIARPEKKVFLPPTESCKAKFSSQLPPRKTIRKKINVENEKQQSRTPQQNETL